MGFQDWIKMIEKTLRYRQRYEGSKNYGDYYFAGVEDFRVKVDKNGEYTLIIYFNGRRYAVRERVIDFSVENN